jgi:hypothetical protein
MTAGHEYGYTAASNNRLLPSWRVVFSAWLVVGFLILISVGIDAAASQFRVPNHPGASAPLVIPRHDPGCGTNVPAVDNDCTPINPALVTQYSQL